jgi:hypothetical protein
MGRFLLLIHGVVALLIVHDKSFSSTFTVTCVITIHVIPCYGDHGESTTGSCLADERISAASASSDVLANSTADENKP